MHLKSAVIPVPARRFSHVHIDLVGPLPQSEGFTQILTMIARSSCWLDAVPISDTSACSVASTFLHSWGSHFGVPDVIKSDRGTQFTSAVWATLCGLLQIKHVPTTAYHLLGNGMLERFHRRLKTSLCARSSSPSWSA